MVQRDRPIQILLVEDSPGDSWLIADILMSGPVPKQIHTTSDGNLAMRYLRGLGEYADARRPDLVLLDLNLPGKTGLDVLREIKADPDLRTLTVIVLTTSDEAADINAAYDLNANCYVVKPMDLAEFTRAIRGIEEFWLGVAMLPGSGTRRYPRTSAHDASSSSNGPSAAILRGCQPMPVRRARCRMPGWRTRPLPRRRTIHARASRLLR